MGDSRNIPEIPSFNFRIIGGRPVTPAVARNEGRNNPDSVGNSLRILGGTDVVPAVVGGGPAGIVGGVSRAVPWQASIRRYNPRQGAFVPHCGGTILNRNYILTAAHCFSTSQVSLQSYWFVTNKSTVMKKMSKMLKIFSLMIKMFCVPFAEEM